MSYVPYRKYIKSLPEGELTTRSFAPLDHELDKEQLNAEATCSVVRVGFCTTAHGDTAEPDIKITR
jgi:hypothetical protein